MALGEGLCNNSLVVVYGVRPEYQPRFARTALKARLKETGSKMIDRQDIACALHCFDDRTPLVERPLPDVYRMNLQRSFLVDALIGVQDVCHE